MSAGGLEDLSRAKRLLENVSLAARLASALGKPIEQFTAALPRVVAESMVAATNKALQMSLDVAIRSLEVPSTERSEALHKVAVGATGAIGGAFGLATIAVELPASTTLMLRSIADIARSEGESLSSAEAKLACLQVFALGGPQGRDDAAETGYFAVRAAMAKAMAEAAEYVASYGVTRKSPPVLVRLLAQIAARFGVPVSEKFIAQSVPVIGAAGGAAINVMFMAHFQDLARGHFIVRRLEREYGQEIVRAAYATL